MIPWENKYVGLIWEHIAAYWIPRKFLECLKRLVVKDSEINPDYKYSDLPITLFHTIFCRKSIDSKGRSHVIKSIDIDINNSDIRGELVASYL